VGEQLGIDRGSSAASVLQASGFRGDATVFRLNATAEAESGLEPAIRRNAAARICSLEAAHNPTSRAWSSCADGDLELPRNSA